MTAKKYAALLLAILLVLSISACANEGKTEAPDQNPAVTEPPAYGEDVRTATQEEIDAYKNSSPENDTDIGLKNTKIDTAAGELTEEQELVLEYFQKDYMFVNSIEALQRYPQIFDNSLIEFYAYVVKMLDSNSDTYTALVCMLYNSNEVGYLPYDAELRYMIVQGKQSDKRLMSGDTIEVSGRYRGTDTFAIDGSSYVLPAISEHYVYILNDSSSEWGWNPYYLHPSRFSASEIKKIAGSIFGDSITVTRPGAEDDWFMEDNEESVYVCILDNQSNAKFSRYYFTENMGRLDDYNGRTIEFSADFQHFFLFSYDPSMETLTVEYYDNTLNRLWKREFEEATSAIYDFTKNNAYILVNNELYIINIETGEDTFAPVYVGAKLDVRKLSDGILLIGEQKSDAIIKTDLDGRFIWKLNLPADVFGVDAVQITGDNLLIQYRETGSGVFGGGDTHYAVVDNETGELIQDAVIAFEYFHQYN